MESFNPIIFAFGAVVLLPLVYVARVLFYRYKLAGAIVEQAVPSALTPVTQTASSSQEEAAVVEEAPAADGLRRQVRGLRGLRAPQTDTVAPSYQHRPFEYTIRRHAGAVRHQAANRGGYAEIPLLIHDRIGNSFIVSRRLSLN